MIETESTGLLTLYSDVKAAAVHWLWYPFIASGKITLLQGDPGDGKSTMMMRLIAELCIRYDVYCIMDEVYEHIVYEGHTHTYMNSLP